MLLVIREKTFDSSLGRSLRDDTLSQTETSSAHAIVSNTNEQVNSATKRNNPSLSLALIIHPNGSEPLISSGTMSSMSFFYFVLFFE